MSTTSKTYTLNIEPVGDHLQVFIPELDITVETASGEIKLSDAEEAGLRAITAELIKRRERQESKAS